MVNEIAHNRVLQGGTMRRLLAVSAAFVGLAALMGGASTFAKATADKKAPLLRGQGQVDSRAIRVTLTEGTSMAAALSPDGRTIVIDLLGALWTLSRDGGRATRILEDGYDARLPAWSPDGQRIAFQAYRSSTWNIWTINRDGSELRQETSSPFDDREPHWSPDGTRLTFSSDRSGNYDIWAVTRATGELRQITTHPANEFMPAWSPDGREIAFVSDRGERGIYAAAVESGTERVVRAEMRTAASPSWSPDGRTITYVAFEGSQSHLVAGSANIADANEDVFPFRAQWSSAGQLLYTADGRIKTRPFDAAQGRSSAGGPARVVEFSADVAFTRAAYTPKRRAFPPQGPQPVRGIMHPAISPDGSQIVFAALGDLWLMPTTPGEATPKRITNDAFVDTDPAWSPDGTGIAFSSDRDGSMDLWIRDLRSGADRKLAPRAMSAAWSPDGTRIAFLDPESQLQIVEGVSGQVRKAHDRLNEPGRPGWSPDGRAIVMGTLRPYSTRFREGTNQVIRVSVDDPKDVRVYNPLPHKSIGMREDFGPVWSPDGTQMAAIIDGHLATIPVARDGSPIGPPRRLSQELANTPSWTRDSRRLLYQSTEGFHLVDVLDGSTRTIVPRLSWTPKTTTATTIVHAGRLFDGRATGPALSERQRVEGRENVDIVIDGNRITRVEPHRADLHKGTVIDASANTVLPGLIESHAHLSKGYGEPLGRIWLSFGITSVRNPASNAYEGQEDREAIESGVRIGPRVFTTGEPFDGTRIYYPGGTALDGGAQIAAQFARAQKLDFDLIKTYVRLPDLLQKRAIEEAHRLGMPVTSHEIYPAVAYGADGVEHIRGTSRRGYSPKMSELRRSYRDVIDLLAASKMALTPTIGIQGGYQLLSLRDGSWTEDQRLQRLFPSSALDQVRALRKRPADAQDLAQRDAIVSPQERMVAAVVKGGGRVIAGTDAPINPYGLTLLLELEHYVRGGLSPAEAIRTATAVPAEAMGLAAQLGTIEAGKLADLVVVEGNPLANISDIRRTRITIKDGVVYELDTLLRRGARAGSAQ
jgi:Tol biopolymer transport system component/imidazolonepropionase-like amidohydrolase